MVSFCCLEQNVRRAEYIEGRIVKQKMTRTRWFWELSASPEQTARCLRFTVRKACFRDETEGKTVWLYHLFIKPQKIKRTEYSVTEMTFQGIKNVTYRSSQLNQKVYRKIQGIVPQPSEQKDKVQKRFSQKYLWSWLLV